ncbi:MAG: DUF58 domain-containing protein [Gammaproteobacteria bacterium]|jgi:uncharacterized protein (DUF58 family)|nr:DUF58 domain-containing protein [Gammaproteobacteria bacterium]
MERFIDPRTLARVKDMPLVARSVAEGFLSGIQPSQQRGVGIEFSQYRAYEPGDEPKRIDWKLFARSDRYFVREADRESEIATWIVVDASHSMAQRSEDGAWDKFDYARHLAATLTYLAQRQGDLPGVLMLNTEQQEVVPPDAGERQWHRILRTLHKVKAEGRFPDNGSLKSLVGKLQLPGLVVVISDFHETRDELLSFMRRVSTSRNDVIALHLLCEDETAFPFRGAVNFEDLESGERILVSGRDARASYLGALDAYETRLRQAMAQLDIDLETINIDQPLDAALHAFLHRRQVMGA